MGEIEIEKSHQIIKREPKIRCIEPMTFHIFFTVNKNQNMKMAFEFPT